MPTELRELIEPDHMAVVTREKQQGILGASSGVPDLAIEARQSGMLEACHRLVAGARQAGVPVFRTFAGRELEDTARSAGP